jgi:hypothetical protein
MGAGTITGMSVSLIQARVPGRGSSPESVKMPLPRNRGWLVPQYLQAQERVQQRLGGQRRSQDWSC